MPISELTIRTRGSRIVAVSSDGTLKSTLEFGTGNAPVGNFSLANGTGTGNATKVYRNSFSVGASGTTHIDLRNNTGSPEDVLNSAVSFTTIRLIYMEMDTPGTGNSVIIGPNGNASGANLCFGNTAGNFTVEEDFWWSSRVGKAVASGSGNFIINNPSATTQTGELIIAGE